MDKFETKLIRELDIIITLHVTKLTKVISELNSAGKRKWYDTLKEEINEACSLLVEEASLFVAVHHFRKTCTRLCKILQISMLPYDCDEITLYEEKKLLEGRMKEYENEITLRQDRLETMNSKQVELCKLLEKVPMTFIEKTIPSETELENLSNELQKLEGEYEELTEEFQETHTKILTALTELNLQMRDDIVSIISSIENQIEPLSKEWVRILQEYYNELQQLQKQEEQKQLDSLKTTIDSLYNACHITESERKFSNDIYNYSLDEIQTEINVLKTRLQENSEQFSLLARYENNWKKLAKDVEEFHRTSEIDTSVQPILKLCTDIEDIEGKLINSTIEFEQKRKESFTTFGKTIPEIIAGLHDVYGKYYVNDGTANRTLSNIITDCNKKSVTETVTEDLNTTISTKSKCNTRKRSRGTTKEASTLRSLLLASSKDDAEESTSQLGNRNSGPPSQEKQQTSLSANISEIRIDMSQSQDDSSPIAIPLTSSTVETIPPENDAGNPKSARLNDTFADVEYLLDFHRSASALHLQSTKIQASSDTTADHDDKSKIKNIKNKKNDMNSEIPSYQEAFKSALASAAKPEYICKDCNRIFKAPRYLAVHEKVHTRKANYCEICYKRFRSGSTLLEHLKRSHKNTTATEIKIIDGPEDVTEAVESVTAQDLENLVFSFESPLLTSSNADMSSEITFDEIRTSFSTCDEETNGSTSHIIYFESLPSSSSTCSESNNEINKTVNKEQWKPNTLKCKKKHRFVPRWKSKFQQSAESSMTPNGTKKAKVDVIQNLFKELDLK